MIGSNWDFNVQISVRWVSMLSKFTQLFVIDCRLKRIYRIIEWLDRFIICRSFQGKPSFLNGNDENTLFFIISFFLYNPLNDGSMSITCVIKYVTLTLSFLFHFELSLWMGSIQTKCQKSWVHPTNIKKWDECAYE